MKTTLILPLLLLVAACGSDQGAAATTVDSSAMPAASAAAATANVDAPVVPQTPGKPLVKKPYVPKRDAEFHFENKETIADADLGDYYIKMHCSIDGKSVGAMTLVFWPEVAPIHVRNFLRYCDEGFYDGLTYHRIIRDFMIQGGCPNGIGNGDGPHGNIKGEFSKDKKYAHKYGVLSMARDNSPDSASCQFYICCEETPSVHNLDGKYSAFGMLVNGVKTLEAIADTKVKPGRGGGSPSSPMAKVTMDKVEVIKGVPTETETVVMPEPDLGGEPAKVSVQHILISFKGAIPSATRSKEDAEKLALEVFAKAKACKSDAEYTALVKEHTDDSVRPGDENPGVYAMLNNKVRRDADFEKKYTELKGQFDALQADLKAAVASKSMTEAEAQAETQRVGMRLQSELEKSKGMPRAQLVPAFGNVGFKLEVGEVGLAPYDKKDSKFGWHIIRRVR